MKRPSRILVPTDFGPASDIALDYGVDLARTFGAALHVLHPVVDVVPVSPMPAAYGAEQSAVLVNLDVDARARLRELVAACADAPASTVQVVVRAVSPANAILEYAASHDIDFIVMGTHGRGAVAHFLLGSVTESVVRAAQCPVLTVREASAEATAARAPRRRAAMAKSTRASRPRKRTVA